MGFATGTGAGRSRTTPQRATASQAERAYLRSLCIPLPRMQAGCVHVIGGGAASMTRLELLNACGISAFESITKTCNGGILPPTPPPPTVVAEPPRDPWAPPPAPPPHTPPPTALRPPAGAPDPWTPLTPPPGGFRPLRPLPASGVSTHPIPPGSVTASAPLPQRQPAGGSGGFYAGAPQAQRQPNRHLFTTGGGGMQNWPGDASGTMVSGLVRAPRRQAWPAPAPAFPAWGGGLGCCNGESDPNGLAAIIRNPRVRALAGLAAAEDGPGDISGEFPTVPNPNLPTTKPVGGNPGAADFRPGNWNFEKCTYAIAFGDTFVGLAKTYLGDGNQWKKIWDAQPQEWRFSHHPDGGKGPNGDKIPVELGEKLIMPKAACDRAKLMLADPDSEKAPSTIGQKAPVPVPGEDPNAPVAPGSTAALVKSNKAIMVGGVVVAVVLAGGVIWWLS